MFWAPMLAMGGLGLLQGAQAQRDQKKHNLAAAESTRYSSWSKQNPMQQRFGARLRQDLRFKARWVDSLFLSSLVRRVRLVDSLERPRAQ